MNDKRILALSFLIIAAMLALSLWAWNTYPTDQPKLFMLLMLPGVAIVQTLLFTVWPIIEPRRRNLEASGKYYGIFRIGLLLILGAMHANNVLKHSQGGAIDSAKVIVVVLCLFAIVTGNYLGKTRSNFLIGLRTPWTLSSDYSWERTHRLAGRLMMLMGTVTLTVLLLRDVRTAMNVLVPLAIGGGLITFVMSYVYWRQDPERHAADGKLER